jgi:ribosomal protein L18
MFQLASMIFSFLGGPVAKAMVSAYQAHLTATTTDNITAANLAGQEIAAQTAEAQVQTQLKVAEIGHPWGSRKALRLRDAGLLREAFGLGQGDGPWND